MRSKNVEVKSEILDVEERLSDRIDGVEERLDREAEEEKRYRESIDLRIAALVNQIVN